MSTISSTSLTIKSNTSKRRTNSRTLSKRNKNKDPQPTSTEAARTVLEKLETIESGAEKISNISFFIMGMLSNWIPKMETIYLKIKNIQNFFKPCYKAIKTTMEMMNGTSVENDPAKKEKHDKKQAKMQEEITVKENEIAEMETKDDQTPDKDRKKACEETKEIIHKIWLKAVESYFEHKSKNEKSAYIAGSDSIPAETYCKYPLLPLATKAHKSIYKHFKNKENTEEEAKQDFKELCIKMRETGDCGNFRPDNKGAWYFIKKTLKYVFYIKNCGICVLNLLKAGGKDDANNSPANEEVKSLSQSAFGTLEISKVLLKEIGSFILHLITFGIWGALRAAWNIIKLTLKIYLMIRHMINDLPYNIGKLVGMAIKITKAFVAGRRRRK